MIEHALIFAAGRGERMRPLSDAQPKPLLEAGGKPLIHWHLEKLAGAGVREVVINTSHLAALFPQSLGDGSHWNLHIVYSYEGERPLETGGGMLRALPLLGSGAFIAVNGDVWSDMDYAVLPQNPPGLAHLVMVDNPPHHASGDFVLEDGKLNDGIGPRLTFAGIGVYRPELLQGHAAGIFPLVPILRAAMRTDRVSGEYHPGAWTDVGTPQRLEMLDRRLRLVAQ